MAGVKHHRQKDEMRTGRFYISCIVLIFAVVMSIQIVRVYRKDQAYIAKQQELQEQIVQEQDRQKELEEYEVYTKSRKYVEDVAKTKLGLLYENEIVFREQK